MFSVNAFARSHRKGLMKAQTAMEYMIIVGIVLAFMLPLWIYVTTSQQRITTELSITYGKNAIDQIVSAADLVYSQGPPAKVTISVYIPSGIDNITITGNVIIMKVRVDSRLSDLVAVSNTQLNGTLPVSEGTYDIDIEAVDNFVQIIAT